MYFCSIPACSETRHFCSQGIFVFTPSQGILGVVLLLLMLLVFCTFWLCITLFRHVHDNLRWHPIWNFDPICRSTQLLVLLSKTTEQPTDAFTAQAGLWLSMIMDPAGCLNWRLQRNFRWNGNKNWLFACNLAWKYALSTMYSLISSYIYREWFVAGENREMVASASREWFIHGLADRMQFLLMEWCNRQWS
jgi:hypothetical protein